MMMTPTQIALVKNTWKKVESIADVAAQLFYGRLFELDPSVRLLFTGDMKEQGAKLMKMIGVAVNAVNEIDTIIEAVRSSGRRHVGYGVEEKHYETVGEALLWTLEKGLGDEFTPEVKDAWAVLYNEVASIMKDAAREVSG
uniref:Hemoglobin-like flavoprotein n=1 Tax=Candidatus Kentrum sp. LPFa TaxID=2126335 RepID=A0A450WE96_9GAMM|nr:MAG: Hemoglobin-like flavoprotein [Candidatus Kentron sp. LPFa]VFK34724.1 MAG: Hemoglobin-like flavoprotein [Candidatus Kentron sp. LPFa]